MCVASSVSPSPGGFFGHGGAGKERKADFKNIGPQTLNWDRGSLSLWAQEAVPYKVLFVDSTNLS